MKALYRDTEVEVLDARRHEVKLWSRRVGQPMWVTEILIQAADDPEPYWVDVLCISAVREGLQANLDALILNMANVPQPFRDFINTLEFD